jgi:hypothetical protein
MLNRTKKDLLNLLILQINKTGFLMHNNGFIFDHITYYDLSYHYSEIHPPKLFVIYKELSFRVVLRDDR